MAIEVILPKVDMDQETGTIVEWRKQDGDQVKEGENILVIETDKAAFDVESPGTGFLQGISAQPGEVLSIGTIIAYILEPGEELPQTAPAPGVSAEAPLPAQPSTATGGGKVTPVARKMASDHGIDLSTVIGTGPQGKITKADIQSVVAKPGPVSPNGKLYATPAARRIARERGIALENVSGSGPDGRIQAADATGYSPSAAPAGVSMFGSRGEDEIIPLQGKRRTIAERLTASYQQIPHITFTSRIDMMKFNEARKGLNTFAERSGGGRVSATAMFVKLVAMALARHPWLNSSLVDENITLHKDVNIGVAVALKDGLIVPVVRNADQKGIGLIASEVNDLATRAREGQLTSPEVKNGTFTISNLGPFGIEEFYAIINPPQAAILALGAIRNEAIPMDDGQIISRPIMQMTLSADHRVIDGAVAAHFIADLKAILEDPILLTY